MQEKESENNKQTKQNVQQTFINPGPVPTIPTSEVQVQNFIAANQVPVQNFISTNNTTPVTNMTATNPIVTTNTIVSIEISLEIHFSK